MEPLVQTPRQTRNMCEFKNVSKSFASKDLSVSVLKNINFTIPEGSFTILYGPSGSGKTTILNTLIGLQPASSGKVCVNGIDLYSLDSDKRAQFRASTLGMVHQDNYWVNSLSVLENIALPLLIAGWDHKKALMVAQQSLLRVGLEGYGSYNPIVLSGGQQQRVSFARATVIRPKLLVADEPTGNLDSKNGELIIGLLQDFNMKHNATVVLVTHNLDLLRLSNNLISVKDGQIVNSSTPDPDIKFMTATIPRKKAK